METRRLLIGCDFTYSAAIPRNSTRRKGRVVIGRGRDASDVAMATTFGGPLLESVLGQAEEEATG